MSTMTTPDAGYPAGGNRDWIGSELPDVKPRKRTTTERRSDAPFDGCVE
jgi:hypothetical protein